MESLLSAVADPAVADGSLITAADHDSDTGTDAAAVPRLALWPPAARLAAEAAARLVGHLGDGRGADGWDAWAGAWVVVPGLSAVRAFRQGLMLRAGGVVPGLAVGTLEQWAAALAQHAPAPDPFETRLMVADVLGDYLRRHYPGTDPWVMAEALLVLFDELTHAQVPADITESQLRERLRTGYARNRPVGAPASEDAISREAHLVWSLWKLTRDTGFDTPAETHLAALAAAVRARQAATAPPPLVFLGLENLSVAEGARLAALAAPEAHTHDTFFWLQGPTGGRDGLALNRLIGRLGLTPEAFAPMAPDPLAPPRQPAAAPLWLDALFATAQPVPGPGGVVPPIGRTRTLAERLALAPPIGPETRFPWRTAVLPMLEDEARAATHAIRVRLGQDPLARVSVVSDDRRFARRLRALLEEHGIRLADEAGWALSTSRAASALYAWLDWHEGRAEEAPYALDALFANPFFDRDGRFKKAIHTWRRLVWKELGPVFGFDRGVARWRAHDDTLVPLFDHLRAAEDLQPPTGRTVHARDWFDGLWRALDRLGLLAAWAPDAAGRPLVETLARLRDAARRVERREHPRRWRDWLARALEDERFTPPEGTDGPAVLLASHTQARLLDADLLILAGCTRERLPAAPPKTAFFNDAVRTELNLVTRQERADAALARFRGLLEAAPDVVLLAAGPADGSGTPEPSPWLELLGVLGTVRAGGGGEGDPKLTDPTLHAAARPPLDPARLGTRVAGQPRPGAGPRLPRKLSATTHQSLVECPYRFHVETLLGFVGTTDDEWRDEPGNAEHGQHIHDVLHAFNVAHDGLAPTPETRRAAIDDLATRAREAYAADVRHFPPARAYLEEFLRAIPNLVDWMIQRGETDARVRSEVHRVRALGDGHGIGAADGRIDRVAVHAPAEGSGDAAEAKAAGAGGRRPRLQLTDFKSGGTPTDKDIKAAESVQLLHYALLLEHPALPEAAGQDLVSERDRAHLDANEAGSVEMIEYLSLKKLAEGPGQGVGLGFGKDAADERAQLKALIPAVGARLESLLLRVAQGHPMPAFGTGNRASACQHCDHGGYCRRQAWGDGDDNGDAAFGADA